jgi:DNA-binding NarL/FixJ family response regulator
VVVAALTRVVLADGHQVVRDGLRSVLERATGVVVVGSHSEGGSLIEALRVSAPDVVVMEAQLPDGDGVSWPTRVKREFPSVRLIVLTGSHCDAELLLALEAGVDGFLYKEDPAESVVSAVREVGSGNFYVSPLAARRMRDLTMHVDENALTARELEVLVPLHEGLTTEEIAQRLCISVSTVKTHLGGIYRKLNARNRVEASREAERRGIVSES